MDKWLLLCLFLFFQGDLVAQDERYYRQMLSGDLRNQANEVLEVIPQQFNVEGPSYKIDLNGDGFEESIIPQKRDGVDWIEIKSHSKTTVFQAKLLAMGSMSVLYKVRLVQLSPNVKTLILYLDEGKTAGRKFESTAKIFFLSYENNDLTKMKLTSGPHFYHEKKAQREQYFRRDYLVDVLDLNNDGIKDIIVHYNHIQHVYRYLGRGEWSKL